VRQRRQRASRFEFGRLHDAVSQLHVIIYESLTLPTLSHKQRKHSKWICNGQVVDVSQNEVASEPALWNRNPLQKEVAYPHFTYGVLGSWPMSFIHMMIELNQSLEIGFLAKTDKPDDDTVTMFLPRRENKWLQVKQVFLNNTPNK
jgi:hypothetical protein